MIVSLSGQFHFARKDGNGRLRRIVGHMNLWKTPGMRTKPKMADMTLPRPKPRPGCMIKFTVHICWRNADFSACFTVSISSPSHLEVDCNSCRRYAC